MSDPRRILIVRPSALGDVARSVPCLVSLRNAFPHATIDWLVRDVFADAVRHHPMLDAVIPFPRGRFGRFVTNPRVATEVLRYLKQLKNACYDAVYDLQGLGRSGVFTWATRAPRRVGFANAPELAWLGYNRRLGVSDATHTVDKMLALLKADGIRPVHDMRLYIGESDREWADAQRSQLQLESRPFAILAPTAMWLSKRWPAERFAEIAARLRSRGYEDFLVVGGQNERDQVAPLFEATERLSPARVHDLVGKTSVGQLMALLERAGLVVCNDSAVLHLSLGLGVRVVGIYGPTDPERVGPYRYDTGLVRTQSPDPVHYRAAALDQKIMYTITTDTVWYTVEKVLGSPPPDPNPTPERAQTSAAVATAAAESHCDSDLDTPSE